MPDFLQAAAQMPQRLHPKSPQKPGFAGLLLRCPRRGGAASSTVRTRGGYSKSFPQELLGYLRGTASPLENDRNRLVIFHHIARLRQNAHDRAVTRRLDFVHSLHRFNDEQRIPFAHLLADQHKRRCIR